MDLRLQTTASEGRSLHKEEHSMAFQEQEILLSFENADAGMHSIPDNYSSSPRQSFFPDSSFCDSQACTISASEFCHFPIPLFCRRHCKKKIPFRRFKATDRVCSTLHHSWIFAQGEVLSVRVILSVSRCPLSAHLPQSSVSISHLAVCH